MSLMPPTTRPLAVFQQTVECDARDRHEVTITTDGAHAFADAGNAGGRDSLYRTGAVVSTYCPGDPDCEGVVAVHLDTPGMWTTDAAAVAVVTTYAGPVER